MRGGFRNVGCDLADVDARLNKGLIWVEGGVKNAVDCFENLVSNNTEVF